MYIYVIFDPNQAEKPQGHKVVQYFEILNSVSVRGQHFAIFDPPPLRGRFLYPSSCPSSY